MSTCPSSNIKAKSRLNVLPTRQPQEILETDAVGPGRFPLWLHRRLPLGHGVQQTGQVLNKQRLHTVCEEARCPNLPECWARQTATFLIMGSACTRNCGFCDIDFNKQPQPLDEDEPERVAQSVVQLNLRHVVITMVARDDLPDGGSAHLVKVMQTIRKACPKASIEVLTSDFAGRKESWEEVLNAEPNIFNHNIETVEDLTPRVRHKATYKRTLELLHYASTHTTGKTIKIKSGLMVGLGEQEEQVYQTLRDLKTAGCNIVTIGQYLQPNRHKLLVKSFVTPQQFKIYENYGYQIGINYVYAAPFVRSSYNADQLFNTIKAED